MIFQFYSLFQQAPACSWKNRLLLRSEFSDIARGVFKPVLTMHSNSKLVSVAVSSAIRKLSSLAPMECVMSIYGP